MSGLTVRVPKGLRWDCRSCGACCRLFVLGPVEPAVVDRLQAEDVGSAWEPAGDGFIERRENGYFLTRRDGHCVFLRDDGLCAIHALYGKEAKPGFCREYPYHLVRDPKGVVAVIRTDCGGLHESFQDGGDIVPALPEIANLPRPRPIRTFAPQQVDVLPGVAVPLAEWMRLEELLLAGLDVTRDPPAAVAELRAILAEATGVALPEPEPGRFRAALGASLQAIAVSLARAVDEAPDDLDASRSAWMRRNAVATAHAHAAAREASPPLDPKSREFLHLALRTHLLAKSFEARGSVAAGLGAHLLDTSVARLAGTGAVGAVFADWRRLTHHDAVQRILQLITPALVDLFLHAA